MVVAGLSVVGVVRSVVVVSPVAGDLPEPLRSEGPRLAGFRSLREATAPPRRGRDQAWGPAHRYRLVPAEGDPVLVELVMRQSWNSEAVVLPEWKGARKLTLRPKEQVRLGRMGGVEALQSCVVRRGLGVRPAALVEEMALAKAIHERQRLGRPAEKIARLKWIAANEAGLGRSEGLACLLVTLRMEGTSPSGKAGTGGLLPIWNQLYAQLAS
jgi:hypothetical protein